MVAFGFIVVNALIVGLSLVRTAYWPMPMLLSFDVLFKDALMTKGLNRRRRIAFNFAFNFACKVLP